MFFKVYSSNFKFLMVTQKVTIWILFLLFLFPGLNHSQGLQRLDNTTDQLSLLSFKSHITNDPLGVLRNWNTNTSFCNWRGVTCNITNQRVTSLNLQNLSLAGTISPNIANLSFLSQLNLQNNSLYGILPPELGRLFRLQDIIVSVNLIQGTIPSSLSLCTRLITIDLWNNKIEGNIPHELGGLLKLQELRLTRNLLTGQIPHSLANLTSMRHLILSDNNLHGSIPNQLGSLSNILSLEIQQNTITGEIPPSLLNSSSLVQLSLAINNLSGSLPSDIFSRLSSLTTFHVGENKLTGPIPSSLANASKLVQVDMSTNGFYGRMPLVINMPSLRYLKLGENQLTSDGMDFIASLANSPQLRFLALQSNRLTGKLPSFIGNLSKELSQLYVNDNQLDGSLPTEISKLVGLISISLDTNSFTGTIPASIGEMPILQRLHLNNNKISGQIPESLGNLTQLYDMRLSQNNLTGRIPASLGNIQQLQILDLSNNMLNGTIPREIFRIRNLAYILNLSSNSLSGSVPIDIGNLDMIQALDLSQNQFSGEIPSSIGNCLSLSILDLSGNFFQGSIPESLANLKAIEGIDLSSNNLSGSIPSSLQYLPFMQLLNLSMNQLEGEIPTKGIFMNSTAVVLSGNQNLCGGIAALELPNCIAPDKHSGGSKMKLIMGLMVGVAAFGIVSGLVLKLSRKKNTSKTKVNADSDDVVSFEGEHRLYTYHDLRIATGNFHAENVIAVGNFGRVYKWMLSDGTPAAIKVFNMDRHEGLKSFVCECEVLRNVRHRNLIRIISACSSSEFKALVLQFMSNGSLDQWLNESMFKLSTRLKLKVAKDIVEALEYLHHDCETLVVYCDLKPSNVLLDQHMTAYLGGFGLAKMFLNNSKQYPVSCSLELEGSIGYIAPEYGMGGEVSPKGDVYSYGILLLEMFTGKKPTDNMFTGELDLQNWVAVALPDRIMDIVDLESVQEDEGNSLVSLMKIGLNCAANSPHDRPTMRDVSSMIKTVIDELLTK